MKLRNITHITCIVALLFLAVLASTTRAEDLTMLDIFKAIFDETDPIKSTTTCNFDQRFPVDDYKHTTHALSNPLDANNDYFLTFCGPDTEKRCGDGSLCMLSTDGKTKTALMKFDDAYTATPHPLNNGTTYIFENAPAKCQYMNTTTQKITTTPRTTISISCGERKEPIKIMDMGHCNYLVSMYDPSHCRSPEPNPTGIVMTTALTKHNTTTMSFTMSTLEQFYEADIITLTLVQPTTTSDYALDSTADAAQYRFLIHDPQYNPPTSKDYAELTEGKLEINGKTYLGRLNSDRTTFTAENVVVPKNQASVKFSAPQLMVVLTAPFDEKIEYKTPHVDIAIVDYDMLVTQPITTLPTTDVDYVDTNPHPPKPDDKDEKKAPWKIVVGVLILVAIALAIIVVVVKHYKAKKIAKERSEWNDDLLAADVRIQ